MKYGHLINRYITHNILFQQIAQPSGPDVIQAIVQVILSHPISYPFVPLHSPGTSSKVLYMHICHQYHEKLWDITLRCIYP